MLLSSKSTSSKLLYEACLLLSLLAFLLSLSVESVEAHRRDMHRPDQPELGLQDEDATDESGRRKTMALHEHRKGHRSHHEHRRHNRHHSADRDRNRALGLLLEQEQQLGLEDVVLADPVGDEGGRRAGCASCADRELFKNFTREDIKDKILRKLGMFSAPNVTKEAVPNKLVRQLLTRYGNELDVQNDQGYEDDIDEDDYHFQTKQINVLAKFPDLSALPPAITAHSDWDIQAFATDTVQLRSSWRQVTRAQLWVHLPRAPTPEDKHAWVNVYSVSMAKNQHAFLTQEAATKVHLRPDRGGWVDLKVWDVVSHWFKSPEANFGLVIQVNTSSGNTIDVGIRHQPDQTPFIQLDLGGSNNYRMKRNLNKVCSEEANSAETHCCLWPFTVDFEKEYGWKWIIHPAKYEANYCSGDCSLGVMMPSNPWAHLLQQANRSPCCAPQKMSAIKMLYLDEEKNVILGTLPNMRVDRCGCA